MGVWEMQINMVNRNLSLRGGEGSQTAYSLRTLKDHVWQGDGKYLTFVIECQFDERIDTQELLSAPEKLINFFKCGH